MLPWVCLWENTLSAMKARRNFESCLPKPIDLSKGNHDSYYPKYYIEGYLTIKELIQLQNKKTFHAICSLKRCFLHFHSNSVRKKETEDKSC